MTPDYRPTSLGEGYRYCSFNKIVACLLMNSRPPSADRNLADLAKGSPIESICNACFFVYVFRIRVEKQSILLHIEYLEVRLGHLPFLLSFLNLCIESARFCRVPALSGNFGSTGQTFRRVLASHRRMHSSLAIHPSSGH